MTDTKAPGPYRTPPQDAVPGTGAARQAPRTVSTQSARPSAQAAAPLPPSNAAGASRAVSVTNARPGTAAAHYPPTESAPYGRKPSTPQPIHRAEPKPFYQNPYAPPPERTLAGGTLRAVPRQTGAGPAHAAGQAPVQRPAHQPAQQPMRQPAQAPEQRPLRQPAQAPVQQPVRQPAQAPVQRSLRQPAQAPAQQPARSIHQPAAQPARTQAGSPSYPPRQAQAQPQQSPAARPAQARPSRIVRTPGPARPVQPSAQQYAAQTPARQPVPVQRTPQPAAPQRAQQSSAHPAPAARGSGISVSYGPRTVEPSPRRTAPAQAAAHAGGGVAVAQRPAPPRTQAAGHGGRGRKKSGARRKRFGAIPLLLIIVDVLLLSLWLWNKAPWSVHDLTLEVGSSLPAAKDFYANDLFAPELLGGLDAGIDMGRVGDHEIRFKVFGMKRTAILHVVDSTPPVVLVHDADVYQNGSVTPDHFITSVTDATETTAEFAAEPDTSVLGVHQVRITVTDAGGNAAKVTANMNVVADTEPPVIDGVAELTVEVGGSVSYKRDVTVTDNCDDEVELVVDNSAVNLNTPGIYPIIYRATDHSGNSTEVTTNLYVVTPMQDGITEQAVYDAGEKILGELFPNGLDAYTKYEIIEKLYHFCHDQIAYVDYSNKDNWVEAAYRGLVERRGDCYVYAMSAKVLLTEAGIPNRDISKIPTSTLHYWNLVDIGEGWHHFDTTRRADGSTFFYLDDEQLMAYSNAHHGTHAYDTTVYTDIVGEDTAFHDTEHMR